MNSRLALSQSGLAEPAPITLRPGQKLRSRYEILRVLGAGGMGAVYDARDHRFSSTVRRCAIKEIHHTAGQPEVVSQRQASFEREVSMLASLSHPAIPKIYEYFDEGPCSYLVLELVRGENLETILARNGRPLPEDLVVTWACEICDVLNYLHTHIPQPIIFRDMKPCNVMLNEHGHVVLIDFGIAKALQGQARGTMVGTEGYAPPEQYRGESSPQMDIYALGATMHHLLTKTDPRSEPPFTFHQRPISKYNASVSAVTQAVVERALAYEPGNRYSSILEMKQALLAGKAPAAQQVSPARLAGQPAEYQLQVEPLWTYVCDDEIRSSARVAHGVLYVGCYDRRLHAVDAATGAPLWTFATDGGIPATPALWNDLVLVGSEDSKFYAVSAATGEASWSFATKGRIRSTARLAYEHLFFGCDDGSVYGLHAPSGQMAWRSPTAGPVRSTPAIADETLYVGCEDGYVYAMNLQRGTLLWRHHCGSSVSSSPAIVNGMLVVGSSDRHVYALDLESGWPAWRYRTGKAVISSPALSGELVLVGSADGMVYALEAASGRLIWKFEAGGQVTSSPAPDGDYVYVASTNGSIYALDVRTGRPRWQYMTGGPVVSSPCVHAGMVYCGSLDGRLYALPV